MSGFPDSDRRGLLSDPSRRQNDILNYRTSNGRSSNRVFAPADPLLSPDRLLRSKASPRGDFRAQYYHRLAGGGAGRKAMPSDDPFTAILRPRNMSISEDQFSMYGDSDNEHDLTLNEASPKMEVIGAEEDD